MNKALKAMLSYLKGEAPMPSNEDLVVLMVAYPDPHTLSDLLLARLEAVEGSAEEKAVLVAEAEQRLEALRVWQPGLVKRNLERLI